MENLNTERRMKQMTLLTIPMLCAAFAPLCADGQGKQSNGNANTQQNYMDEINKITPSANPDVHRWADPYLTADFIWWKAVEQGLDYGFNGTTTFAHDADKGKLKHPKFSYEPGFKVGFGLKGRHDGWDFFAQYTRLVTDSDDTKSHINSDSDGDSQVQSNIVVPEFNNFNSFWAEEAEAKWNLNFNVIDLELGRNFWISKRLTLRPFVGLKFDWTTQKFHVEYEDLVDTSNDFSTNLSDGDDINIKMHQDQWAAGLRTGLNTSWYMWNHWTIFGDFALSGMVNDFNVKRTDTFDTAVFGEYIQNHVKRKAQPVTAVLEFALGLRFETTWHHDDYMFQLQAGWEEQIWFGQNQFIFFPNGSGGADLSFQGLTVKAAFWF